MTRRPSRAKTAAGAGARNVKVARRADAGTPAQFILRPRGSDEFDLVDDRGSMRWVMTGLSVTDLMEIVEVCRSAIDESIRSAGKARP